MNIIRRSFTSKIVAASALFLSACAPPPFAKPPSAHVETNKAPDYTKELKKLSVIMGLTGGELTSEQLQPFLYAFPDGLRFCGVENYVQVISLSTNKEDMKAVQAKAIHFQPEAILTIAAASHHDITTTDRFGGVISRRPIDIKFQLSLADLANRKTEWKAEVNLLLNNSGREVGIVLADSIIKRMQVDGLISSACSQSTTPPATSDVKSGE